MEREGRFPESKKRFLMVGVFVAIVLAVGLAAAGGILYQRWARAMASQTPSLDFVRFENGEVLDLTWAVRRSQSKRTASLAYKVELYDAEGVLRMTLDVNCSDARDQLLLPEAAGAHAVIRCPARIRHYDADGKFRGTSEETFKFQAYLDGELHVHMIFDAADDAAARLCAQAAAQPEVSETQNVVTGRDYRDTFSAMRFVELLGLDPDGEIYARVAASDDRGVCGDFTQSNGSNLLTGGVRDDGSYEITNARHLFNIRFLELIEAARGGEREMTYIQNADFTWYGEGGIVANSHVYNSLDDSGNVFTDFLPLDRLSSKSVYDGDGHTISGLRMTARGDGEMLGFVRQNDGEIKNITFRQAAVLGSTDTATSTAAAIVSAENQGRIRKVSVSDSYVLGGDYVGGIAGRSRGELEECTVSQTDVSGQMFVGGVAGVVFSGVQADGCGYTGGNVSGGCFVGGIAGINQSQSLLDGDVFEASPALVRGQAFVGGIFGANFARVTANHRALTLNGNVYHDTGEIVCSGPYAGGMTGINALFLWEQAGKDDCIGAAMLDSLPELKSLTEDGERNYREIVRLTEAWFKAADRTVPNENRMPLPGGHTDTLAPTDGVEDGKTAFSGTLAGSEWTLTVTAPRVFLESYGDLSMAAVRGQVYVGGVIGCHIGASQLRISHICDRSSIYAGGRLAIAEGMAAYAGGLIGCVSESVTVSQCMTDGRVSVEHSGTYRGSIAEINEGHIEQCVSAGAEDASAKFLGGIAGLNRSGGVISACRLSGTLTGISNVGGIVSVNRGTVTEAVIDGDVNGYGHHIGGVTGVNEGSIRGAKVNKSVRGLENEGAVANGDYVGGVAGLSRGVIEDCAVKSGGISGRAYVGGFVGCLDTGVDDASKLTDLVNETEISAQSDAGGIAGYIRGAAVVTDCVNEALIVCAEGRVGGITAYLAPDAMLMRCSNFGRIDARTAEMVGAVCGLNEGRIEQAVVSGNFKFTGSSFLGGIAGVNRGHIVLSAISEVEIILQGGLEGSCVGGIAGENNGTIVTCGAPTQTTSKAPRPVSVYSNTSGSYVGGVAGQNSGSINGLLPTQTNSAVNAKIEMRNKAQAYVGGIAGFNGGEISNYTFLGTIRAASGEMSFTGPIAGFSADGSRISGCMAGDDWSADGN